jgi:hypothetical protein
MALFPAHLEQARKNIDFLQHINNTINDRYDWQVTVCYYVAVHLINGYLADKVKEHYRTHHEVSLAINPFKKGIAAVSEETYKAYRKLQMLSRRSRYLINDAQTEINPEDNFLTHSVHFHKSLRYLDEIMNFIESTYPAIELPVIKIKCIELKKGSLKHFDVA